MPWGEVVPPWVDAWESRRGQGDHYCKQQRVAVGHHPLADVEEAVGAEEAVAQQQHGGDLESRMSLLGAQLGKQAVGVLGAKQSDIVREEAESTMQ